MIHQNPAQDLAVDRISFRHDLNLNKFQKHLFIDCVAEMKNKITMGFIETF